MYPLIVIGSVEIPTFSLCAVIGTLTLIFSIFVKLRVRKDMTNELYYIIPKLFIALGFGLLGAIFLDALFKIPQNGGLKLSGIMFYGGLIAGLATLIPLLIVFRKNSSITPSEWMDMITVPFIVFHAIGRLGCFFGGCCYGKTTDGALGLHFPDNPDVGIFHYGQAVYPTQLYEAAALLLLAIVLHFVKNGKFRIYCLAYPIIRFSIEFLRGDDRGAYLFGFSPAQILSVILFIFAVGYIVIDACKRHNTTRRRA